MTQEEVRNEKKKLENLLQDIKINIKKLQEKCSHPCYTDSQMYPLHFECKDCGYNWPFP